MSSGLINFCKHVHIWAYVKVRAVKKKQNKKEKSTLAVLFFSVNTCIFKGLFALSVMANRSAREG